MGIKKDPDIDYKNEILTCIRENPGGLTTTDIKNILGYSRPTIYKYLKILEDENEILSRKIGAYTLYFSSKTGFFPLKTITSYYKALLKGIKANLPNNVKAMKKLGRDIAKEVKFKHSDNIFKALKEIVSDPYPKILLESFRIYFPFFDLFQPELGIEIIEIDNLGNNATYRFRNSIFCENSEDYIYHMYITCGIIEVVLSGVLKREVVSNVEKIHISDNIEESYFDLSIKINNN